MTCNPAALNPGDKIADVIDSTDVQFTVLARHEDPRSGGGRALVTWEIAGPDDPDDEGRDYTFFELSEMFGCKRPRHARGP